MEKNKAKNPREIIIIIVSNDFCKTLVKLGFIEKKKVFIISVNTGKLWLN